MSGKFKTFVGDILTLGHPPGPDSSHPVSPTAKVTLNGLASKMGDLKADDTITLTGTPATVVAAVR